MTDLDKRFFQRFGRKRKPDHHYRDLLIARNGRWGCCSECPRDAHFIPYPERCANTDRYDHHISMWED